MRQRPPFRSQARPYRPSRPNVSTPNNSPAEVEKRKLSNDSFENSQDLRAKIPRLNFNEEDNTPCNLHQSFDDLDRDTGLSQPEVTVETDPLDVSHDCDVEDEEEEVVTDPAPVDDSLILFQQLGQVIDDDWKKTVTNLLKSHIYHHNPLMYIALSKLKSWKLNHLPSVPIMDKFFPTHVTPPIKLYHIA